MVLLYSTSAAERPCCPPHGRPGAPRERLSGATLPLPSRRDPRDGVAGWGSPCGGTRPLLGCRAPGQCDRSPGGRGLPLTLLSVAGRTKKVSPERLERFTRLSRELGLTDEQIAVLPETGEELERGGREEVPRGAERDLWGATSAGSVRGPAGVRGPPAPEELISAPLPPADKCMLDAP